MCSFLISSFLVSPRKTFILIQGSQHLKEKIPGITRIFKIPGSLFQLIFSLRQQIFSNITLICFSCIVDISDLVSTQMMVSVFLRTTHRFWRPCRPLSCGPRRETVKTQPRQPRFVSILCCELCEIPCTFPS